MNTHELLRAAQVRCELERMDDGDLYDALTGALGKGWLKRLIVEQRSLTQADLVDLWDWLALDEPSQSELNDEEGRYYDRQRGSQ